MTVANAYERTLPAATEWVALYGDLLYRYALGRVADTETARDLVQEALLAAVRARKSFSGHSSPRTWFVGILKHKIADHFRRTGREAPLAGDGAEQELFDHNGQWKNPPSDWRTSPVDVLGRKEFWRHLRECLADLPPRQAGVFTLRELEGMDTDAICQAYEVTPTNVWVLLHRARMGLRRCLEAGGFGNPTEEEVP